MSFKRRLPKLALATICAVFTSVQNPKAQLNDVWVDDLMLQLAIEEACDVVDILRSLEGQIGDKEFVEATVQCEDGRQFDASRTEPDEKFTVQICEIVETSC